MSPFMRRCGRRLLSGIGILALLWVLVGYILYPALTSLVKSLAGESGFSLGNYAAFFSSSSSLLVLQNTLVLGALTVLLCGVVGTGLAFLVHFFECTHRDAIDKLLLLPVMMPGIIIVFAFVQLYGESGLVTKTLELLLGLGEAPYDFSGLPGILFVHVYTQYVYFYLTVSLSIRHIDLSIIESARILGASRTKAFTSVILPSIAPALITSAAVTFMTGIGSFSAPSIIGGRYKVLTTQILLSKANNFMETAAVQVVVLTVFSLLFFAVLRRYERRRLFSGSVKGEPFRPFRIQNTVLRRSAAALKVLLILLILLPFLTIIVLSFVDSASWMVNIYPQSFSLDNFMAIFAKRRKFAPFLNSIEMSVLAASFCLLVAVPSAWIIDKTKLKVKGLIEFLVILPWALPASAIAINIITATSSPTIFSFNTILVGSYILLPMGYFIKSLPIVVKVAHISFQGLNQTVVEASKSLGATGSRTFHKIILPVVYPGLLAGFLYTLVRSIGEYTVSAFLYNASNKPMSIAMVNAIFEYDIGLAMAYGTLLIVLTVCLSIIIDKISPLLK
ncbi:iron ABC transporter permease [Pseudodesulfovibrio thermohalotolerans]|uniref:ABC transporter permease n=1 Tax=Pseudodesulfovibrio thermohalotolerans TaxID=2880651 RepID=UPI002442D912|nr:iron ABC transporter permease [Pseudodesulfovibrio thermohalotolerans]WFS63075.1 iron ABC transporter permease [Pseudodesulfovibrio thermohalotolerans]